MDNILKILQSRMIFIIFCLLVIYGLFGIGGDMIESRLGKAVWNMNHLIAFFIGNLFLFHIFPITKPNKILNIVLLVAAMIIISGGIEFIQKHIGREASYDDIALNMSGTLMAISAYMIFYKVKLYGRYFIAGIFICIAMALSWPNIRFFLGEYSNFRQFPVLADFSKPFAVVPWRSGSAEFKINMDQELNVTFLPGHDYSNFIYSSFYGQWDKYQELVIDISNPEPEPLKITIRLHDTQHKNYHYLNEDRFSRSIILLPGENQIIIPIIDIFKAPKSRLMDLQNLEDLIIFMSHLEKPRTIVIKKMYLR